MSGHIVLLFCYERLENLLLIARKKLSIVAERRPDSFKFTRFVVPNDGEHINHIDEYFSKEFLRALGSQRNNELTRGIEYFLATGNLITRTGIGLMQETGFAVAAERINQLRFVSHFRFFKNMLLFIQFIFRAIHRGAFFTEMRTTDVRKLRPEAWGFICPVINVRKP